MPDNDDVIRVGIEGDPSDYLKALSKMLAETKTVLSQMEAKYSDTIAKIDISTKTLNNVVASVNKQYGEGAAQLPIFTQATSKYTDEIVKQTKASQELRLQIIQTNREIKEQETRIAAVQAEIRAQRSNPYIPPKVTPTEPVAPPEGTLPPSKQAERELLMYQQAQARQNEPIPAPKEPAKPVESGPITPIPVVAAAEQVPAEPKPVPE